MSLTKQYFKYVSQNIFGLLGTSCYILADTYFISQAAGTSGVALLNLCLPIYNFIFAIGSMLGLGAATRYAILRAQGDERSERYFSNALLWALVFALPFMLAGIFCPEVLLRFMGGDAEIVALGVGYARIFLLFTPFFMCNYIVSAFVRNDGDPSLAMVATLCGSLFNVVFDYIFMFPMGLGLPGAALATAVSPVLSIAICSRHFFKKSSTVRLMWPWRLTASWRTTRWWRRLSSTAWPRAHSRWSASATAKTMPPVPANFCCWAAEQRLRWRRHCMQFCSGSPGRSSRSSTVRTRPSWRSMPSAGCASTSSAISSRASISWPPAIWARWTAPQRLLRRRFPAASWPSWPALWC